MRTRAEQKQKAPLFRREQEGTNETEGEEELVVESVNDRVPNDDANINPGILLEVPRKS